MRDARITIALPMGALLWVASVALVGPRAFADARTEARRAFHEGMALIEAGEPQRGIALLEQAYDLLPHPNVLYNIGRAYAEIGEYEASIDSFERYLDTNPPDADVVAGFVASMRELLDSEERASEPDSESSGAEPVEVVTASTPVAPAVLEPQRSEPIYEERVVSASRFSESAVAAPSSTTQVTAQDVRLTGHTNFAELLRRAAGVEVMTLSPGSTELSIRGLNQRQSNKVLVFIDGRSVYVDLLGSTYWQSLPLSIEDVERIEVIRGPASALYGADAFSGIVNIITREPGAGASWVSGLVGNGDTYRVAGSASGTSGTVGYRLGAGVDRADQYALDLSPDRVDRTRYFEDPEPDLGREHIWVRGDLKYRPARGYTLRGGSGLSLGTLAQYGIGRIRQLIIDDLWNMQTYATLETPVGITARTFWNATFADVLPIDRVENGIDAIAFDMRTHVLDAELLYAGRFRLLVDHGVAAGLGYRLKTVSWSWLDEDHVQHHVNGFLHDTMTIASWLDAVFSLRVDRHPLLDRPQISPRGAAVVKVTPGSAIRASAGRAFRSPTFLESYLELPVGTEIRGAATLSRGSVELSPERMLSVELGYANQESDYLSVEANAYWNVVSSAILFESVVPYTYAEAGSPDVYDESLGAFLIGEVGFQNESAEFRQLGGELAVKAFPVQGLDVYANYAIHDTSAIGDQDLGGRELDERTSQHKVNVGVQYRAPFGLDLSLDVHWSSAQVWYLQVVSVDQGGLVNRRFDLPAYTLVNARVGMRFFDDRIDVGVVGTNLVDIDHREHPFGQPIPMRIMGTFRLSI